MKKRDSKKLQRNRALAYVQSDAYHWHRRILKEMKSSPRIIDLVVSGRADKILNFKKGDK